MMPKQETFTTYIIMDCFSTTLRPKKPGKVFIEYWGFVCHKENIELHQNSSYEN